MDDHHHHSIPSRSQNRFQEDEVVEESQSILFGGSPNNHSNRSLTLDHSISGIISTTTNGDLASISASVGWYFPQVKLASWDPENEKQWAVREIYLCLCCFLLLLWLLLLLLMMMMMLLYIFVCVVFACLLTILFVLRFVVVSFGFGGIPTTHDDTIKQILPLYI